MADVVERLRTQASDWDAQQRHGMAKLNRDAATEIETLRARLSQAGAGGVVRSGADMIRHHRFTLHEDGNTAEIDSSGLAEEIDAALAASPSAGEPVAWRVRPIGDKVWHLSHEPPRKGYEGSPLYATPSAPVQTASVEAVARAAGWYPAIGRPGKITRSDKRCQEGVFVDSWAAACEYDGLTPAPTQGDGCPHCGGTGEWTMPGGAHQLDTDESCNHCDGTGSSPSAPVSAPSPAGGVREAELVRAASALLNNLWQDVWSYERSHEENWREFDRKYPGVKWLRDARDAALSAPATPEPVSAPAGEVVEAVLSRNDICRIWQEVAIRRPNLTVEGFTNLLLCEIDDRAALSNPAPGHGEGGL